MIVLCSVFNIYQILFLMSEITETSELPANHEVDFEVPIYNITPENKHSIGQTNPSNSIDNSINTQELYQTASDRRIFQI